MRQTEIYAQALLNEAHKDGADAKKLVAQLAAHLKADGREKLLSGILRDVRRISQRNENLEATVEVAHEKDSAHALKAAAEHGIHAEKAQVNHQLISGWRATGNGKVVDSSAKRALIDLYRNVTS